MSPWGARIIEGLAGQSQAWLARQTEIDPSTISDIIARAMPNADFAVRIARVLDVTVEWLMTGEAGTKVHGLIAADAADWVTVPHYRLGEFTETAKPEPIEVVPLRRDWLNRNARTATNLWLTDLPATTIEGIGEEGDTILCRDAESHYDEGVYLYFWDGVPVVRKFSAPKLGQLGDGSGRGWESEDLSGMRVVARILGTIKLRAV